MGRGVGAGGWTIRWTLRGTVRTVGLLCNSRTAWLACRLSTYSQAYL